MRYHEKADSVRDSLGGLQAQAETEKELSALMQSILDRVFKIGA